jgi:hypothetical protein
MSIVRTFFCWVYFLGIGFIFSDNQFILTKNICVVKIKTKNELKEAIGQEIQELFTVTTNMNKNVGLCQITLGNFEEIIYKQKGPLFDKTYKNMIPLQKTFGLFHVEMAQVQQNLSCIVERLVDNQKPFKKASHDKLREALTFLQGSKGNFIDHNRQITLLNERLKSVFDKCIDKKCLILTRLDKSVSDVFVDIKNMIIRMKSCECLKIT